MVSRMSTRSRPSVVAGLSRVQWRSLPVVGDAFGNADGESDDLLSWPTPAAPAGPSLLGSMLIGMEPVGPSA